MVGKVMGKDVLLYPRVGEAKGGNAVTGSIPARRRRSEWVRKEGRGMKEPDRCLYETEGRNSIARVGSGAAGLSNPTGHV
jgi:hypothetical protein